MGATINNVSFTYREPDYDGLQHYDMTWEDYQEVQAEFFRALEGLMERPEFAVMFPYGNTL